MELINFSFKSCDNVLYLIEDVRWDVMRWRRRVAWLYTNWDVNCRPNIGFEALSGFMDLSNVAVSCAIMGAADEVDGFHLRPPVIH